METPENVVNEDGGDESWEHPRPAAWSPSLASFPPPTLILVTNLSNLIPYLVVALR
jgi:hypothetical protein